MATADDDVQRIEDYEVESFSRKLESWAQGLEPGERALVTIMLAQARRGRELSPEGLTYESREPLSDLIDAAFGRLLKPGLTVEVGKELGAYFAKEAGPSWVKGSWVDHSSTAAAPGPSAPEASAHAADEALAEAVASTALPAFARKLENFDLALSLRERRLLRLVLLRAMDPIDRVRATSDPDLLDPGQQALLDELSRAQRPDR